MHDTAWLRFDDEGIPLPHHVRAAQRARLVIVPSAFAGSEVAAGLGIRPERIRVVHNGFDSSFSHAEPFTQPELASRGLPSLFLLHSGGCSKRKNLRLLAATWQRVASADPDLHLLLCGPSDARRTDLFVGLPRVLALGKVSRDLHVRLMATAMCVAVPSLYEGFGLPALEAMAAGTPVVAATGSSLEEVCGDAAMVVAPGAESFAEAILALRRDETLRVEYRSRGRQRALGFSWDESARQHEDIYQEALR